MFTLMIHGWTKANVFQIALLFISLPGGRPESQAAEDLAQFHLPNQQLRYSFDAGPVHFLALNYRCQSADHPQYQFAQPDRRVSKGPWKIVFLHKPVFNFGGLRST